MSYFVNHMNVYDEFVGTLKIFEFFYNYFVVNQSFTFIQAKLSIEEILPNRRELDASDCYLQ